MIPAAFDYQRPTALAAATALLQQHGDDAKLLAGGQSLLPMLKFRLAEPKLLIDLGRIAELSGIRQDGNQIVIGAMTTHFDVLTSPLLQRSCPLLAETAAVIGDQQVRALGTIGGSLIHADPGADMPAALIALGATARLVSASGERTVAVDDLLVDVLTTSIQPTELLVEIRVPLQVPSQGSAYEKFPSPASRFAVVGVAAVVGIENDKVTSASIGLTGGAGRAQRLAGVENALVGQITGAVADATAHASDGWVPNEDLDASAEYRQHLARVHVRRALERAISVAGGKAAPRFGFL